MQASNANSNYNPGDQCWYLLAELSLSDFLSDRKQRDELAIGSLFQVTEKLGALPEWLASMEVTLAAFAEEALGRFEQGGRVRVFCQKKIIDDVNLERAALQPGPSGQAAESAPVILDSIMKMNGGWGYYVIEKGRGSTATLCKDSCPIIEIYLYRESIDIP